MYIAKRQHKSGFSFFVLFPHRKTRSNFHRYPWLLLAALLEAVENTLVQFEIGLFTSRFTKTITAKKGKIQN